MSREKILIVDDEQEICEVTKSFLTKRDYIVYTALTDIDAIDIVKNNKPDLVLLDVRLGMISGMDILRSIRDIDGKIKVIMVTGLGDDESIEQAKTLGAIDYIIKPFTADYLDNVIKNNLSS